MLVGLIEEVSLFGVKLGDRDAKDEWDVMVLGLGDFGARGGNPGEFVNLNNEFVDINTPFLN